MNKDLNSRLFSTDYGIDDQERLRLEVMLKMVGTGKDILDVGCRDGTISKLMTDAGNNVEAVEISDYSIIKARGKGIKVYDIDLNTSWAGRIGKKYDLVFAGEIIEHLFETDMFLQNINKVLKKGGILVISTPNTASLGRRILLLLGKNPATELTTRQGQAGHVRYFVYDSLKSILEDNGFFVADFRSDVINMDYKGKITSSTLAKIFPTLGRSLIIKAIKKTNK
jgi:2-polyprenyl-3-methyl-5-hydroxy-6-metoxy-1,4-benzoquinol methylase